MTRQNYTYHVKSTGHQVVLCYVLSIHETAGKNNWHIEKSLALNYNNLKTKSYYLGVLHNHINADFV